MLLQFDITEELNEQVEDLLWRLQQENPGKEITKAHILNICIEAGLEQIVRSCRVSGYAML